MGIGMQIVYAGFGGSARVEAEACVQLLRLERMGVRLAPVVDEDAGVFDAATEAMREVVR